MNLPLKCSVNNCASTLYSWGFQSDQREMLPNNRNFERKDSKDKKGKTKISANIDDTTPPSFADEEFIVFQLNKDGGLDFMQEEKSTLNLGRPRNGVSRNDKAVRNVESSDRLQFRIGEDGTIILDDSVSARLDSTKDAKMCKTWSNKSSPAEVKSDGDDVKEISEIEEIMDPKTISESTRSNSSASSFAFPVVNLETVSSPEKMPKCNEHKKTEKILKFPCCNF